jgi:hypothetical protein
MDSRTIVNVRPDPDHEGHTLMDLSDGSTVTFGSFGASNDVANVIVCFTRNADGSLSSDGPVLDDAARAKFEAIGVENIPVPTPVIAVKHEDPAPVAPSTPEQLEAVAHLGPSIVGADVHAAAQAQLAATPGVTLSSAEHARTKSIMDRLEDEIHALPAFARAEWAKLRALLKHV